MTILISSDEIKKTLPNYIPSLAEQFHRESAVLADKNFGQALKKVDYDNLVTIMGGGAASGKTEFLVTHLINDLHNNIILDTALSSEEGARIKLRKIKEAKKELIIYFVIPDDLHRAYIAFLNRDRKFSDDHFLRTHSGSRKTLLWISKNYPDIKINLVESSYTEQGNLRFAHLLFSSRVKMISYLTSIQISEADIIKLVTQT